MMPKLYIYGYLQSRAVEPTPGAGMPAQYRDDLADRTVGAGLQDHRGFRKDNDKAIREVCREFVALCRKLDLLVAASVAIDGSKFKAVNARDKNFTEAR